MAFIASSIAPSFRSGNGSAAPFEKSATHPAVACIDKQPIYLSHPILINEGYENIMLYLKFIENCK